MREATAAPTWPYGRSREGEVGPGWEGEMVASVFELQTLQNLCVTSGFGGVATAFQQRFNEKFSF